MPDVQALIATLRERRPILGTPGYPFPEMGRLAAYELPGHNNVVLASKDRDPFQGRNFDIDPRMRDNVIVIDERSHFHGRIYIRGSDNIAVVYGVSNESYPINIHFAAHSQIFYWGPECTSNTTTFELGYRDTSIIVGEDCMFSAYIDVKTSDDHCIFDWDSGEQINHGADILIEPHVWVGLHATILKGVTIGSGSVIAARSLVVDSVLARSVVGGVPARIIRINCGWIRDRYMNANSRDRAKSIVDATSQNLVQTVPIFPHVINIPNRVRHQL